MPSIREIQFFEYPTKDQIHLAHLKPSLKTFDYDPPFWVPQEVWDRASRITTWRTSFGDVPVQGDVRILDVQDVAAHQGRLCKRIN